LKCLSLKRRRRKNGAAARTGPPGKTGRAAARETVAVKAAVEIGERETDPVTVAANSAAGAASVLAGIDGAKARPKSIWIS
jgi:hypothetical protein